MKKLSTIFFMVACMMSIFAQQSNDSTTNESTSNQTNQTTLNAEESNPIKMGWMQGFPPPQDKILSAKTGSFFDFPGLRYSVNYSDIEKIISLKDEE